MTPTSVYACTQKLGGTVIVLMVSEKIKDEQMNDVTR